MRCILLSALLLTATAALADSPAALANPAHTRAEASFGHDGSPIVLDEVVGQTITLAFLPLTPGIAIAGFFLFRATDIAKAFPAGRAQRLPGGLGVVADDVIAGVWAHLLLRLGLRLFGA